MSIYIGKNKINNNELKAPGKLVEIEGEKYYQINNYQCISPFFMTITSNSDHWMFISSNGGLTCGRKDRENALFPYYTDDKIHDSSATTGNISIFLVSINNKTFLWEPFTNSSETAYNIERKILKNITGNKILFQERNKTLGISFIYGWKNSHKYGFIKDSRLINESGNSVKIDVLDGVRNILPYGVTTHLQSNLSTLVDAYKKSELDIKNSLGLFTLSSILTDKAEPSEALKATTLWSFGLDNCKYLLSESQINQFKTGKSVTNEIKIRGKRGAYLINSLIKLDKSAEKKWQIVANLSQDHSDIAYLINKLEHKQSLLKKVKKDIKQGTLSLLHLISNADGIQETGDDLNSTRHLSNTMFNIMRGGIYYNNYLIPKADYTKHVQKSNIHTYNKNQKFFKSLKENILYRDLITQASKTDDSDLIRLSLEYLPLTFSRRHGDPSRPWNYFSIDVLNKNGEQKIEYQGNWRDIFQNWEALSHSFPGFIEGIIAKFLNASTPDGYNPYRITKEGFDWEILDPEDPWSNIGYWGDHQIIYLLKLLELSEKFFPKKLSQLLHKKIFVYANVPYEIKDFKEILKNPYDTILYNNDNEQEITKNISKTGTDGKLILTSKGEPYKVNLLEKLLVPILSKLSNFVPEGGIWLNTQRPEWNDANNALVGYGLSMVTVYHLRRAILFYIKLLKKSSIEKFDISAIVDDFYKQIFKIFSSQKHHLNICSDTFRKDIVTNLGNAGSKYRKKLYKKGFDDKTELIHTNELINFLKITIQYIDKTIEFNKKQNGLYHSYNIITFTKKGFGVKHLGDMLEGQVAVLSSGKLNSEESLTLLKNIRKSELYCAKRNSYMLYPNKELLPFTKKNNINKNEVSKSHFLTNQLKAKETGIIQKDCFGIIHFNGIIKNANQLENLLKAQDNLSKTEIEKICDIYIKSFNHKEFTGRSGTFFKYEGLGSIYWHMVSKLLLATQENYYLTTDKNIRAELKKQYYLIKDGLGIHKSPEEYGGFPIDPYSHTPNFTGAQQPGMTGQVKEDILSRFGELGLIINKGKISFHKHLIKNNEFIDNKYLSYTFCGISITYVKDHKDYIEISHKRSVTKTNGLSVKTQDSKSIFNRENVITKLTVHI